MKKQEYRYIFHNPNQKEEMEKIWISLLVEMYTPKLKAMIDSHKERGNSGK